MAMSRDDRDPSRREDRPYAPPPNIRTTGELPAVTGEINRYDYLPPGQHHGRPGDPDGPPGGRHGTGRGGSVVDRPPPSAPDWMSGVDVPELLVTRELGRAAEAPVQSRVAETAQRILGLVLVTLLVAAVALVAIGAIFGFR